MNGQSLSPSQYNNLIQDISLGISYEKLEQKYYICKRTICRITKDNLIKVKKGRKNGSHNK